MSAEVRSGGGTEMRSPSNKGKRRRDFHENEWIEISVKGEMGLEKKRTINELEMFPSKQHWKRLWNFPPS